MEKTTEENERTTYVRSMFNSIAKNYDFLNHFLSGGVDVWWRNKAMQLLLPFQPKKILDVACGTGDFSIAAAQKISPQEIIGVDIADEMLHIGRKKIAKKNLQHIICLETGVQNIYNLTDIILMPQLLHLVYEILRISKKDCRKSSVFCLKTA